MKTVIIGGGSIGSALARRFLLDKISAPNDLLVVEQDSARIALLKSELNCQFASDCDSTLTQAKMIVLAVKPKDSSALLKSLAGKISPQTIVISVMAGVSIATLTDLLGGHKLVVRSMPNIPIRVAAGMTVYKASDALSADEISSVDRLFGAVGKSLRVADESLIDSATAVSGSGPAYVFYLIEKMMEAAKDLGFTETEAEILVAETFRGATEVWRSTGASVVDLRRQVTTPGGTTAAAFEVFDKAELGSTIRAGIKAAFDRSKTLG